MFSVPTGTPIYIVGEGRVTMPLRFIFYGGVILKSIYEFFKSAVLHMLIIKTAHPWVYRQRVEVQVISPGTFLHYYAMIVVRAVTHRCHSLLEIGGWGKRALNKIALKQCHIVSFMITA